MAKTSEQSQNTDPRTNRLLAVLDAEDYDA